MTKRTTVSRQSTTTNAARSSSSGLSELARERPLLVVGVGVLVGMTLGALLPWSRIEDELLGDQAEKLKDSARELASDGLDKVKSVVRPAYESVTEAIRGTEPNGGPADTSAIGPPVQTQTFGSDPYRP